MEPNKFAGVESILFEFIRAEEGGVSGKSIGVIRNY